MITLGIDLSSMPKATAACLINWRYERAEVKPPILRCTDDKLDILISQANAIGIDAPFGWPRAFVEAVASWQLNAWSSDIRKQLQFRETDLHVQRETGIWPLSVTSNFIALPAMRAMALLQRHGVTDRSGDGRFFEVYPAGSLHCWKMRSRGYKRIDEACAGFRQGILKELRVELPWLEVSETYADSSDSLDALVASLTVRAAVQGSTGAPNPTQREVARLEGWIHLPTNFPTVT